MWKKALLNGLAWGHLARETYSSLRNQLEGIVRSWCFQIGGNPFFFFWSKDKLVGIQNLSNTNLDPNPKPYPLPGSWVKTIPNSASNQALTPLYHLILVPKLLHPKLPFSTPILYTLSTLSMCKQESLSLFPFLYHVIYKGDQCIWIKKKKKEKCFAQL